MWGKVNITEALKICCTKATRNGKYVLWGYQHSWHQTRTAVYVRYVFEVGMMSVAVEF